MPILLWTLARNLGWDLLKGWSFWQSFNTIWQKLWIFLSMGHSLAGNFFSCSLYFNFLVGPSLWQLLSVISVLSHFTIPAVRSQKSLIKVAWLYVLRVKNLHSGHPQTYRFHEMRLAKQSTSHYYARQSQGTYITTSVFNCLPSVGPKQLCAVKTKVRT